MKKIILGLMVLISSLSFANEEIQTIGIAPLYSKSMYKADNEVRFLPLVNLNYKDFYMKDLTFGYNLYQEDDFKFSLMIDPLSGYVEGWTKKGSDFKNGYDMDDRDTQFMGGLALEFSFTDDIIGDFNYTFGEYGSKGELGITKIWWINDRVTILPSASFKYYSKDFLNHYVGVSEKETRESFKIDQRYSPNDSFSVGLNVAVEISITEQLVATTFIGMEYYDNEINDSPIIDDETQIYGGIGFRYSFY